LISVTIANFAITSLSFALATFLLHVQTGWAFQASSPKTFSRPSGRLFFGPEQMTGFPSGF